MEDLWASIGASIVAAGAALAGSYLTLRHGEREARASRNHDFRVVRWSAHREAVASFLKAVHFGVLAREDATVRRANHLLHPTDSGFLEDARVSEDRWGVALGEIIYFKALLPPALQPAADAVMQTAERYVEVWMAEKREHGPGPGPHEMPKAIEAVKAHHEATLNFERVACDWLASEPPDAMMASPSSGDR